MTLSETHVRKAFKDKGDDTTLSRFVKVKGAKKKAKPKQHVMPGMGLRSVEDGRSIFWRKGVKAPADNPLVSGHNNVKIGRDVRKGKLFRGYWIYTLSLEERATCPRSCDHWHDCYGNNMPFAKRIAHQDAPALEEFIVDQVSRLLAVRGRAGVLVRLHALGDFFDVDYVNFWGDLLDTHPNLACYGYTARDPESDIGWAITKLKLRHGRRFAIRLSNGGREKDCTISIASARAVPGAFVCPEQTGGTKACATCALCWETDRNVAFIDH